MNKGALILPVGPPGCGKSVMAEHLVAQGHLDPEAVVCPDQYRLTLTGTRGNQHFNREVFGIVDTIVRARMAHHLLTYLDATNLTTLNKWSEMAKDMDVPLFCIRFLLSRQALTARNETRPRYEQVPPHVLENMMSQFDGISLSKYPGITITPDEVDSWAERGWSV